MNTTQILADLKLMGNENTRRIFMNHGAPDTTYGVKVEDLKKIQKKVKKNHELSLELYKSGISDAQYLAGLIADETKISKEDLQTWADGASWLMLSEYIVPWIAAESRYGLELALVWIESKDEKLQASGWATLSNVIAITADEQLDIQLLNKLMHRVEKEIFTADNRVKYCMNGFLIAVGSYVVELSAEAVQKSERIGKLTINMGNTACKVPYAPDYIKKVADKGKLGIKKKMARC